ncbi:hypothetical protein Q0F98_33560 [Paenibacillus amylolyticus]|nr:hypothetical protein Q0F98_33560 [Paenibacillus amylolyticus]
MTESVKNVSNDDQSNQDGTVGGDQSGWIAGIDIGGTKTLMLLSSQQAGSEVHERILPTLASDQPDEFFRWLFAELETFCHEVGCSLDQLNGAGLGFPWCDSAGGGDTAKCSSFSVA